MCSDETDETELAPLTWLDRRQVPKIHFSQYVLWCLLKASVQTVTVLILVTNYNTQNKYEEAEHIHRFLAQDSQRCAKWAPHLSPCTCPPAWRAGSGTGR